MKVMICPICGNRLCEAEVKYGECCRCVKKIIPLATPQEVE